VETHRWLFTPKVRISLEFRPVNDRDRKDLLWLMKRTPYVDWQTKPPPSWVIESGVD
jgi:hypothetical protein